jgi:hypothetical protein
LAVDSSVDVRRLLRLCGSAVRIVTPPHLVAGWGDDLVQETAISALRSVIAGFEPNWRTLKRRALEARRQVFGDRRYRVTWDRNDLDGAIEIACPAIREEQGLAMWRLQKAWPLLTQLQQRAVVSIVTGEANTSSGRSAKCKALAKIRGNHDRYRKTATNRRASQMVGG